MNPIRAYLDDLVAYGAADDEYGLDGEYVDVQAPVVPRHIAQVGAPAEVRISYANCDVDRVGWFRFHSITEPLDDPEALVTTRVEW